MASPEKQTTGTPLLLPSDNPNLIKILIILLTYHLKLNHKKDYNKNKLL